MSIDISAKTIQPIRHTYANVARRLGEDKPASRYQEATFDVQATTNFHFRPTWAPQYELHDPTRTAIQMQDWYAFQDPRQFYYGVYTMTRARQQDSMEKNFDFVAKRGLLEVLDAPTRERLRAFLTPLRHVDWAANMNNCFVTDFGYGTAITQASIFAAMDRLGIAQYVTRIALTLDDNDPARLDQAKQAWLEAEHWQELRRYVEDSFVIGDWFETLVAQKMLDDLLFPLVYDHWMAALSAAGGSAIAMLTEFMSDWHVESLRWSDALLKVTAAESDANGDLLTQWSAHWLQRADDALAPLAAGMLGDPGGERLAQLKDALSARLAKQGIGV